MSGNPWVEHLRSYFNRESRMCPLPLEIKIRLLHLSSEIQSADSCDERNNLIDTALKDIKISYEKVKEQQPKQLFTIPGGISAQELVAMHMLHQEKEKPYRETLAFLEKLKNINPLLPAPLPRYGKTSVLFLGSGLSFSGDSVQEPVERLRSPRCGKRA